jgi:hypothetical protein
MPFVSTATIGGRRTKASPNAQSPRSDSNESASFYPETNNTSEPGLPNEERVPLLDGHRTSNQPRHSSGSGNSVIVSPSVRALAALSGSPLPVSPQHIEAETLRRTSSIPRSRLQSPSNGLGSRKRCTYHSSTAQTADLIEAFPEPPHHRLRSRNSVPARLSLFPALAGLEERCTNISELSPTRLEFAAGSSSRQSFIRSNDIVCDPSVVNNTKSPSASNVWVSGALPNPPRCDGSADTIISNSHPVRGEDVRYRHSGTPVYNVNTTSLQNIDQADDDTMVASLSPPGSPASGRTGMTRFFSAASQIGTTLRSPEATTVATSQSEENSQSRDENRTQQERAVANGALRFVSHTHSAPTSMEAPRSAQSTNIPVTFTSHGKACTHKRSRLRPFRLGIDGAQESGDCESEQSIRSQFCLTCQAKRVVGRLSRLVRSGEHTRISLTKLRRRHSS